MFYSLFYLNSVCIFFIFFFREVVEEVKMQKGLFQGEVGVWFYLMDLIINGLIGNFVWFLGCRNKKVLYRILIFCK